MSEKPTGTDATLAYLALDAGDISPGFSPARTAYALHVPHWVAAVQVSCGSADAAAHIAVAGKLCLRGVEVGPPPGSGSSPPVPLAIGRNLVPIEVASADGSARVRYEVKVVRAHPAPDWVRGLEAAPWRARDSAGELVHDGRMWLFGGYVPELVSDVWASADGVTWTEVGAIPSSAGINIPAAWSHGGRMWVADNDGALWSSADGSGWSCATERPPWGGRYAAGAAVHDGRMWAMAGMSGGVPHNDIWSSADGVEWTLECNEAPWSRRQLFSMLVAHDHALWVLGGGLTVYHPFRAYTDVWRSADGRQWTQVTAAAPWPARIWSSAVSYANRLWVVGGFRAEPTWNNFDDLWYSADGARWHRLETEHRWSPRHELSAYVHGGRLWVAGGNAWPLQRDVWSLQIDGLTFLSQPVVEEFCTARYAYRARADLNASCDPVRYRLVEGPDWLSVDGESGLVQGTAPAEPGVVPVELEARDGAGESARQRYELHVIRAG